MRFGIAFDSNDANIFEFCFCRHVAQINSLVKNNSFFNSFVAQFFFFDGLPYGIVTDAAYERAFDINDFLEQGVFGVSAIQHINPVCLQISA